MKLALTIATLENHTCKIFYQLTVGLECGDQPEFTKDCGQLPNFL